MSRTDPTALLEPQIPALRRYARALVGDPDVADDLVQDCLERALSRWWMRRPGEDPRPWLFTILRNLHLDRLRQRRRQGRAVAIDEDAMPAIAPDQDGGLGVRDALAALELLPEEQKSLLLLVGVEDLSYEEAARVLGIPIGTVMSRLARGRQRFRAILETGRIPLLRRVK
ncbi:sigma-70 family RNA polymerase sigma factor [Pinisolibacter aquiterrae]|uniref:sigma-70 family RNA polymerase sigma factor n=1 Tax=Pinisolibacter aquiterrae TaxID=2815579 RepID=UPI001C3CDC92|nr:sigma-70 family RNA polymerase sigma factor [Pinisolibacter aquiterrae]MBV5263087.1 sigma-70 family RNA polymerase sigma factor [Pinisolibacter aquiterrae]MCC8234003.1 sigma-70 family RNA polymerase sigma factor [Pinisolibacter aquiterrae]